MSAARIWFLSKYKNDENKIYTSKFYTPDMSWPKTNVWWFQVPLSSINMNLYDHVNLVCQAAPNKNEFHYLKVPTKYFHEHLKKFHRIKEIISIYLSAEPVKLFEEERGEGRLDFSRFLINS